MKNSPGWVGATSEAEAKTLGRSPALSGFGEDAVAGFSSSPLHSGQWSPLKSNKDLLGKEMGGEKGFLVQRNSLLRPDLRPLLRPTRRHSSGKLFLSLSPGPFSPSSLTRFPLHLSPGLNLLSCRLVSSGQILVLSCPPAQLHTPDLGQGQGGASRTLRLQFPFPLGGRPDHQSVENLIFCFICLFFCFVLFLRSHRVGGSIKKCKQESQPGLEFPAPVFHRLPLHNCSRDT